MQFIIDKVIALNQGETLAYTGGTDGYFIQTNGAELHVGTYTGGIPYITDAIFKTSKQVTYKTAEEATAKAMELAGHGAVISLFTGAYTQYVKEHGKLYRRAENGELILVKSN